MNQIKLRQLPDIPSGKTTVPAPDVPIEHQPQRIFFSMPSQYPSDFSVSPTSYKHLFQIKSGLFPVVRQKTGKPVKRRGKLIPGAAIPFQQRVLMLQAHPFTPILTANSYDKILSRIQNNINMNSYKLM